MTIITGALYLVATPIGNLADITQRATDVLKEVDLIAAEDTRHSKKLLVTLGVSTPLISLHDHNEKQRVDQLVRQLEQGKSIALVSDAGTPLISDPGYALVHTLKKKGISVIPLPGPCALIAALSASGLPTDRFVFEGFVPRLTEKRRIRLECLLSEPRTTIYYESGHRIVQTIKEVVSIVGEQRNLVLAKELTKVFETIIYDQGPAILEWFSDDHKREKGEFVLLVEGVREQKHLALDSHSKQVLALTMAELPLKKAVKLTAAITGGDKKALYQYGVELKERER